VFLTTFFGPRQSALETWHKEGLPEDDSYVRIQGLEHIEGLPIDFGLLPLSRRRSLRFAGTAR